MSEQSEWEKRRGDMIALLQGANWDDLGSRDYCGAEMGHMSYVIYSDDLNIYQAVKDELAADTSSVNLDSGDPAK
tara:strand:+ start:652 stop:876 length:225 start_codon:yes stop_codon:yes gene_type:complete